MTVHRGGKAVLSDIDLEVEPGELLVVIGPSGSGKSTLLSAIACLVPSAAGRVDIDGKDVARLPRHEVARRIGYCFQGLGLFPHMTVAQNIGVTPELLGWDRAQISARVDALLEAVALDPAAHRERMPDELSGARRSGWRWRARWPRSRRCCSWTSLSAPSIPRPARARRRSCSRSIGVSG